MSKQKKQMDAPDREQGSRVNKNTAKRLLSYIGAYKKTLVVVFICIILSALASVASAMFIEILIDDYITPILAMDHPVYTGLIKALCMVGVIYLIGVFSTWFYNYLMVGIAQGTLKTIRDEMFEKMQSLPIRYFDTHTHGDIMSCYTNDTDTLRQMIAQSLSQMISSICTVVAVFCCMLYQSIYLTLIVVVMLFFIMKLVNVKEKNGELVEVKERTGIWAWKHPHEDGSLTYQRLEGDIVLDHVDFSYNPDKQILRDVTLYAKPGQKIAFVGATGAGKTTITNLINRFYDIDDGKIRYDGININKIRKKDLRASLGIVLQEVNLFTGTVMENLKYGNPNATDEECIAAAKLANAHNFIMMLPNGYDTVLAGDGSGLSQGQRQLISIARAAVSNPPVMILDEATSSIDTRTEAMVQQGMDRLMEGRTVFVIAHRLSTVKNSDVIMVLDHGAVIERGTHEDLIAKKGTYYQLYTGAFELE